MSNSDTSLETLELLSEALSLGLSMDDLMTKKKDKPDKPDKPKRTAPQGLLDYNKNQRLKPGDMIGVFEVIEDTGKTAPSGGGGIYLTRCTLCGEGVRERSFSSARRANSCGCLKGQAISDARNEEQELRELARWMHVFCDPEQTVFPHVRRPGILALYADESDKCREMLSESLSANKPDDEHPHKDWSKFNALESIVGGRFLEILDLCQGDKIEFPKRELIVKLDRAVEMWLRLKDGASFDELGREFGASVPLVVRFLFAVSLRLQYVAFRETAYAKHNVWEPSFCAERWGDWETVTELHNRLYQAMVEQGDKHMADEEKARVERKLQKLEKQTKILGVYDPKVQDT
jgi:hypothetical protein